jgi:hypothetical protein
VRARLEQILPDAQVTDFRESNPALTDGLKRSTGLLSLICLVAMVLGAIGVAMAMRAHLQQRVEVLAIMKSIGARSSDILRIYLFQTVLLGLVGGLIGVLLGLGVEWVFPSLLGRFLPMRLDLRLPWHSAVAGLATGRAGPQCAGPGCGRRVRAVHRERLRQVWARRAHGAAPAHGVRPAEWGGCAAAVEAAAATGCQASSALRRCMSARVGRTGRVIPAIVLRIMIRH